MLNQDRSRDDLLAEIARLRARLDKLAAQETVLSHILAHVPCAVFWKDRSGAFLGCNERCAQDMGFVSPEAAIGKTDHDWQATPEEVEFYARCDREVMETGHALINIEETQMRPDGKLAVLLTSKVPLRDEQCTIIGVVGVYTDITDRKVSEEALRQSEARYRSVVEGSIQGIIIHQDNRILFSNAAAARIFGFASPDEMIGLDPDGLEAPEERHRFAGWREACLRGELGAEIHEWQGLRKDGSRIWVESTVTTIHWNGRPAFVSFRLDITKRKHLEDQFRQAQKMEAVGRLAGGIAHDFNNLLTAILGYSDLVLSDLTPGDPQLRRIEEIHRAGERAAALTQQLLAYSRKQILTPKVLNLNAIITDMVPMLRRLIGEDIDMVARLSPDLWAVRADPGQLEQVILNLAVNARDAMPRGGMLALATTNINPDDPAAHPVLTVPAVRFEVSDTGCGMSEEVQTHLWEPFYTTKPQGQGTGLGLCTVAGIIEQSGGQVTVESQIGQGTMFRIDLPRADAVATVAPSGVVAPPEPAGRETVLLVEDEEAVRSLAKDVLTRHGCQVIEARHADEALELCRRNKRWIDLLITDMVMPGRLNGGELATQLVQARPGLKVLFISGYAEDNMLRNLGLTHGAGFLHKPFSPQELIAQMRRVLCKDQVQPMRRQ